MPSIGVFPPLPCTRYLSWFWRLLRPRDLSWAQGLQIFPTDNTRYSRLRRIGYRKRLLTIGRESSCFWYCWWRARLKWIFKRWGRYSSSISFGVYHIILIVLHPYFPSLQGRTLLKWFSMHPHLTNYGYCSGVLIKHLGNDDLAIYHSYSAW